MKYIKYIKSFSVLIYLSLDFSKSLTKFLYKFINKNLDRFDALLFNEKFLTYLEKISFSSNAPYWCAIGYARTVDHYQD